MQCVDCGELRHRGPCNVETCAECGEPSVRALCPDCKEFLDSREARAALAWFDVMEEQNERAR